MRNLFFSVFALFMAAPALADDTTCRAELVNARGAVLMSFYANDFNFDDACYDALQQCQNELEWRNSQGRNRKASCRLVDGLSPIPGPRPFPPNPSSEYAEVACSSRNFNYTTCNVGSNISSVNLLAQHSNADCIYGETYGFTGDKIWVNNGCRGLFGVWKTQY
jgi:hypothetical protein